jgi:2-C-methyl-D-erythritol 4-phosphate cytidylyltransferase
MSAPLKYWVIIPAAGSGQRMQSDTPKQYLSLAGHMVIEHVLQLFAGIPGIQAITVATSTDDPWWPRVTLPGQIPVYRVDGGRERCHSVLNALESLMDRASADDWIMVHDAARPCLRHSDASKLMGELAEHEVGGLLGMPVRDTMKRTNSDAEVCETVERQDLWHALTPQMFRFGLLRDALVNALDSNQLVTDESSAVEFYGKKPRMVTGHGDNIKITRPEDLALAEFYLQQSENS